MKTFLKASAGVLALGAATPAAASGFLAARFGGELGHPTTANPSAIYYNPAGLALGEGTRLYLDGTFALRSATYERPEGAIDNVAPDGAAGPGTPRDALSANSGSASLSNFVAAPFAALVTDFGVEGLGVGLGLYAPLGGSASWDANSDYDGSASYPGAVDGVQRWWSIDGTIRSLYVTGAAAYKIEAANLSLGLGVNLVRSELDTIRARNSDGSDDMVTSDGSLQEGRSWIQASNTSLSLGGGLIWEPVNNLYVGASYQSQPGFGEMRLTGKLSTTLGTGEAQESDVEVLQSLPDVFRLGLRYRQPLAWEARLFAEYARWSLFEKQCIIDASQSGGECLTEDNGSQAEGSAPIIQNIPRQWEDAFGVRGGFSYWLGDVESFVGLGYDANAVPDETLDPALMDMDKVSASLGARFSFFEDRSLQLVATFTQIFYFEREIEVQARDDGGVRDTFVPPSRQPDAAGTYDQSISVLNLGVEYAF